MNEKLSPAWLIEKLSHFELNLLYKIQSISGERMHTKTHVQKADERSWCVRLIQFASAIAVLFLARNFSDFQVTSSSLAAVSFLFGKTFAIAAVLLAALAISPEKVLPKSAGLRLIWFTVFGCAIAFLNSIPNLILQVRRSDTTMATLVGVISIFATVMLVCIVLDGLGRTRAVRLRFFQYACACGAAYFLPTFIRFLSLKVFIIPGAENMSMPFSSAHILVFTIVYVMHEFYIRQSMGRGETTAARAPTHDSQLTGNFAILTDDLKAKSLSGRERVFISHALSPVYFISAFPIPVEALQEYQGPRALDTCQPGILASWNLFVALLWGVCSLGLARVLSSFDGIHEASLFFGLLNYLFFYFYWLAILRASFAVGLGFGYKLKEPSQFALLASNPIERWKRWNRYFYDWFLLYVFLPLSRKTGRVEIGLLAVFLIDLLLHNVGLINSLVVTEIAAPLFDLLKADVIFYAAQGLVLYLSFQSPKLFPTGAKRIGWVGVGATNLIMIAVHTLARFH